MYTNTPRDNSGKFESWNTQVDEAGSYDAKDAAIVALAVAAGAALWKFGEWVYEKVTND